MSMMKYSFSKTSFVRFSSKQLPAPRADGCNCRTVIDNYVALSFAEESSQFQSSHEISGWGLCFNYIPVQPLPLLYCTSLAALQKLFLRAQLNKAFLHKNFSGSVSQRIYVRQITNS